MSATKRTWNESAATMDWTPFPVGYGILLNERYQFPMDMALVRMKLDNSRQLFVDNHVIAHMEGLTRETHSTRSHPANPVFAPYDDFNKGHAFTRNPGFGNSAYICPDPEHGFRLYYNGPGGGSGSGWALHVAYSSDGVNWDLPELNVFDDLDRSSFPGGPNNVVSAVGELNGLFFEPDDPNPERRWKAIHRPKRRPLRHTPWPYLRLPPGNPGTGAPYELHVSPDGLRWTFEAETNQWKTIDAWDSGGVHGLYSQLTVHGDVPQYPLLGGGDVFRARWDPILGKYVGNTKHYIGPDRRMSPVYHAARVVGQIESDDLVHWSAPRIYAYPDGEDAKEPFSAMQGIYEADGYPYESMWLNNFSMSTVTPASKEEIRDRDMTRQYSKNNWIRLAASRDGRHWYYFGDRKPFIPLRPEGRWKEKAGVPNKPQYLRAVNLATTGGPIIKDDELWFYYRGGGSTGIAVLRRDGFASLNADEDGGLVFTRPFIFEGEGRLHVNAEVSAGGYVRAAVVDEDTAEELGGFTEHDSVGVTEGSTRAPLCWGEHESLGQFKDRYVRLAFHLKSAKLYSFWVE